MAYVFRRGWSTAYRRSRRSVVSSGAINVTLSAAAGGFVVAGVSAAFNSALITGAGSFAFTGISALASISHACGSASFSRTGIAATFRMIGAATPGAFAVSGVAGANFLRAAAAPGAFVVFGLSGPGSITLAAAPTNYTVVGTAANYARDFEAWVRRPYGLAVWQAEAMPVAPNWLDADLPLEAWTGPTPPTNTWSPAANQPEPWTIE
jgi:hypothetical protein